MLRREVSDMQDNNTSAVNASNNKPNWRRRALLLAATALTLVALSNCARVRAADAPPASGSALVVSGLDADGKIRLIVNRTTLLTTRTPVTRVSVGQQEIADVNPIGGNTILVTAK